MSKKELFKKGTISIGVNYWASHAATKMWSEWNERIIENDIKALKSIGCEILRVFPLWSDFQPVMVLRSNCYNGGFTRSYAFTGERPIPNTEAGKAGVDEKMMERFERLCDLAEANGMKLIVPLINGHMTFRIYCPPAVDGLNHFTDPNSLMWQTKFVRYFVKRMKHHKAILAWEIGNESNCLGRTESQAEAYAWTALITNTIRAEDNTRPVSSGMHSLELHPTRFKPVLDSWTFSDQAELCDSLTSHPYPMWKGYVNCDKPNTLRWCLHPVIENQMYQGFSGCESFVEEIGTLRRTFSTFEALGDQLKNVLWLLWGNDSRALLWWCAFDQTKMEFPPYDWDEAGMEHGVLTADYAVNPTGKALADFAKFKASCPVKALPDPREKAVCIFGRDQKFIEIGFSAGILAKQAGLPIEFKFAEDTLPESKVYIVPCVQRKGGLSRADYHLLRERVENGATVYMSFDYGMCIPEMTEFFGFEIESREKNSTSRKINIADVGELTLYPQYNFQIKSHGARQLDNEGTVWEYKVGKGRIIAVTMPIEAILLAQKHSFQSTDGFKLYKYIGDEIVKNNILESTDREVIVTEHPYDNSTVYAIVTNCSCEFKTASIKLTDGWGVVAHYSDTETVAVTDKTVTLPNNSSALLVLKVNKNDKEA